MSDDEDQSNLSDDDESLSPMKPSKKRDRTTNPTDDQDDDDDDIQDPIRKKKKSAKSIMIDDAAVHSGSDDDDDSDDEEDEGVDNNDYERDGFVVDDDQVDQERKRRRKRVNDLEDSDDEGGQDRRRRKEKSRLHKKREELTDDDIALIREAQGIRDPNMMEEEVDEEEQMQNQSSGIKARSARELQNELFKGDDGVVGDKMQKKKQVTRRPDNFDDDGMDDFIDDGEDGRDMEDDMYESRSGGRRGGVNEAQLNEANEIFGTDFLQFMEGEDDGGEKYDDDDSLDDDSTDIGRKKKFRERGTGVSLGVDSGDEVSSDEEEDDLFGSDDENVDESMTESQRIEAKKLRREKRRLAKEERRKAAAAKREERRQARLRKAFEPVQLIENFATEKDDEIRKMDCPERFYDWNIPHYGYDPDNDKEISMEEEEEAVWIVGRIPEISSELYAVTSSLDMSMQDESEEQIIERKHREILDSIAYALRYLHRDQLEPEFIKRYRADIITSAAVRNNLYKILDEDAEWNRLIGARTKVQTIIQEMTDVDMQEEALCASDESIIKLKEKLKQAQDNLDANVAEEQRIRVEIENANDDDDDDEDLFGDEKDDDDDEDLFGDDKGKKPKKEIDSLKAHLKTSENLVKVCSEQVATLTSQIKDAEEQLEEQQGADVTLSKEKSADNLRKICKLNVWNAEDLKQYTSSLNEYRHAMDVYSYLKLIKEGNSAIRSKNSTLSEKDAEEQKKRSRRFDRDYYRTCVAQGLRSISYQFALSPFRVGIKLDGLSSPNGFNYELTMPGETTLDEFGADAAIAPNMRWSAPKVDDGPMEFASDLVGTGELILLAQTGHSEGNGEEDPLRGCRYVAALELAHEPRVRKHLRNIYRQYAVLTTRPTAKGLTNIDAFHEFYGLHLLKKKKVKDHFPPDEREVELQKMGMTKDEQKELDEKNQQEQCQSCIQYVSILKAERSGHIKLDVHLPLVDEDPTDNSWFKKDDSHFNTASLQDVSPMMEELEKVYLPEQGDIDEWNEERRKILKLAISNFLLPQFAVETKRELREISMKMAIDSAGKNLYEMAMEGPYRPSHLLGESRILFPTGNIPIVGVCCSSDGRDASYLAAVTAKGEVTDHLAVPAGTPVDSNKIREKVISFLIQTRPKAIIVGTCGGLLSRTTSRKLSDISTLATTRWNNRNIQGNDEDDDDFEMRKREFESKYGVSDHDSYGEEEEEDDDEWKCNVETIDDNVAQLFGRSVRSKKEFPDMAVNQKCAIAIARYAKDPLAELSATWNVGSDTGLFGTEMLYINVHPLQQLLPKHLLLREYERRLCDAVAQVGVDVNLACQHEHLRGLLSFVPGLGPRKAQSLQSKLAVEGSIVSRKDLLANRLMGPIVYNNSVAFLKIKDSGFDKDYNPLDNTRLHPDVYHSNTWAAKVAIDALEMTDVEMADEKELAISAIRDIMQDSHEEVKRLYRETKNELDRAHTDRNAFNVGSWDPKLHVPSELWQDKVEELDLDTFAEMIQNNGQGKWHTHLSMIKWEFRLPFVDPRKPMEPIKSDKLFHLLTGESDHSLCPGREVTGKVVRNSDFGSHVKLEGDVPGFIPLRSLADQHVEAAEDVVQVGAVITAIVTQVKKDHMSVDLSLKLEDMNKSSNAWERPKSLPPIDSAFDSFAAAKIEEEKLADRKKRIESLNKGSLKTPGRSGKVTRRACAHPAFRNAKNDEVEQELKGGGAMVGDAIIRPSSKIADSLALHWLVRPGVTRIIEVEEEDKDTDASIGNILKVKDETYGDIDELLARFIAPMNDRVDEILNHRKFQDLTEKDVDASLKKLKANTPSSTFYWLCWSEAYPGYVSLRYIINSVRYHPIAISPNGYIWCRKTYKHIDAVLADFKKYPRGLQQRSSSQSQGSVSSVSSRMNSTVDSRQSSRFGGRSSAGSTMTQSMTPSVSTMSNSGTWGTTPASTSVNSYSQQGLSHSNGGWSQQKPPPPSLPPPPQHGYPPMPPPGAPPPPGFPPIQR